MCSGLPPHQTCHPHSTWSHHMPWNKIRLSPGNPGDADRTTGSGGSMGSPVGQPHVSCWPMRAGSLTSQLSNLALPLVPEHGSCPQTQWTSIHQGIFPCTRGWGSCELKASPLFHCWLSEKNADTNKFHLCKGIIPHSNLGQVENNRMLSLSPKENGTISSRNASVASHETPPFLVKKAFSTRLFLAGTSQFTHALFYHTNTGTEAF